MLKAVFSYLFVLIFTSCYSSQEPKREISSQYISKQKVDYSSKKKIGKILFEKKDVVEKHLTKLLKITHDLVEVNAELRARMKHLAGMMGPNPDMPYTAEGYSRTDAFG